jgi:hypothetical protein
MDCGTLVLTYGMAPRLRIMRTMLLSWAAGFSVRPTQPRQASVLAGIFHMKIQERGHTNCTVETLDVKLILDGDG